MDQKSKRFQTVDMCRFCTKVFPKCGADPVRSESLNLAPQVLDRSDAVVACDLYESPVEILKTRLHDY